MKFKLKISITEIFTWIIITLELCLFRYSEAQPATNASTVFYAPNPGYDAYWIGGGWVFGNTITSTTTNTKRTLVAVEANRNLVCGQPCPRIYRKLKGQVCVHKIDNVYDVGYNGWWAGSRYKGFIDWSTNGILDRNHDYMRSFDSYCKFKDAQCRTHIYHGMGYVFIHMGPCIKDEHMYPSMLAGMETIDRKKVFLNAYKYQLNEAIGGHAPWQ